MFNPEGEKSECFDVRDIYTPLSEARMEIQRRWNDKDLHKKVEDFLGGSLPDIFKKSPKSVLARHVITPNSELFHFLELTALLEIEPIGLEYLKDKYLSCNPAKLHLGKVCFFEKCRDGGKIKIEHEHIIDFINSENKLINEIETLWGENIVNFHGRMLKGENIDIERFDISDWYGKMGGRAKEYMKYYMALFICNGVLFENYLTQKNEKKFTYDIVLPAFKEIENMFGLKPLIVPIMPLSDKDETYWWAYPNVMRKYLNKNIKN